MDLMELPFQGRSRGFLTDKRTYSMVRVGDTRKEDGRVELLLTIKNGRNVLGSNLRVFGQRHVRKGHKWSFVVELDGVERTLWTRHVVQILI